MASSGAHALARLGRYELIAKLASGGMGEIFLARLEGAAGFEKLYVVKRVLPHLADDARFRQMLIAEAQITSRMAHPNICQVYELGETAGQLYIVMEYLEGVTLLPMLRRAAKADTPLAFGLIGGILQQACEALHYAHELKGRDGAVLGVIHRDVTPSNIFVTESGVAKILDFGIAKAKGASTNTQTGAVKGKYAYMSPEQLRGASIDHRVDVFALGIVLYEMLALRRLFQRATDYLTFQAVIEQPIPDVRRYRPDAPEPVIAVMMQALSRDPDARPATVRQFGTAFLDALASVCRPWSQGEIRDFMHERFGPELGKRTREVEKAIRRTHAGTADARVTMPLFAHGEEVATDLADDGFPSVETEVDASPRFATPVPVAPPTERPSDFAGGTPPPFDGESSAIAPSLQPLPAQLVAGAAVAPRRSLVWPLVALAMVAVAAAALFLVWRQSQRQPAPAVVNITSSPVDRGTVPTDAGGGEAGRAVASGSGSAAAEGSAGAATGEPHRRPRGGSTAGKRPASYDEALARQKPALLRCLEAHRADGLPQGAMFARIKIGASGKARSVSLDPARLNAQPLGACLRNVLLGAPFPKAKTDVDIRVPLKATGG